MTTPHPDTPELDELRIEAPPCKHCGAVDFVPLSNQAKTALTRLLAKRELEGRIAALEAVSFAVIEPCEPDCDAVRHALHEGSWNAHTVIEDRLAQLREELAKYE